MAAICIAFYNTAQHACGGFRGKLAWDDVLKAIDPIVRYLIDRDGQLDQSHGYDVGQFSGGTGPGDQYNPSVIDHCNYSAHPSHLFQSNTSFLHGE